MAPTPARKQRMNGPAWRHLKQGNLWVRKSGPLEAKAGTGKEEGKGTFPLNTEPTKKVKKIASLRKGGRGT